MKKLEKFIKKAIQENSKIIMPTKKQLETINRLSFNKSFYWSLFLELYLWNESWDEIEYEDFEKILKEEGRDALLYSFAINCLQNGNYPIAIKALKRYIKKYPNHLYPNFNIAQAYYEEGEKEKAIKYYEKSLEIDLSDVDTYLKLGKIHKESKEYNKALKYYKTALNLTITTHEFYDIMLKMHDIYRDTKKKKEAVACYKKAIKKNNERDDKPRNYYLYIKSGWLSKSKKKCIENYKKAIEVRPERYEAYYILGIKYIHRKDNKAIKLFKKSLKLNPQNAQAQVNMGVAYGNLDKDKKALKCYKRALALDSSLFQAYINIFSLYEEMHKYFPKKIEDMFIKNFKENRDVYVMYIAMGYLVDIYHGKEIDLTIFEKKYKNAGMECCTFNAKEILKKIRKKDKKKVSELLEILKKNTKIIIK